MKARVNLALLDWNSGYLHELMVFDVHRWMRGRGEGGKERGREEGKEGTKEGTENKVTCTAPAEVPEPDGFKFNSPKEIASIPNLSPGK